jgi:hypothetical protein
MESHGDVLVMLAWLTIMAVIAGTAELIEWFRTKGKNKNG